MSASVDYLYKNEGAFSSRQLTILANARIAVGGLGAYGSAAVGLAQTGVATGPRGLLRIADPDVFERHNANRQADASVSQVGRNKTDVIGARIADLVPEARVELVQEGVTWENLDAFLEGIDLLVDAVDYLRPDVKLEMHRRARALGIPVVTGLLVNKGAVGYFFAPDGPSFEQFFSIPADPALRETWALPGSRIIPHETRFPWEGASNAPNTAQLHLFEVLSGQRHITSNSMAASALGLLINHMATAWLTGENVPSIPHMLYLDPTTYRMGTIDMGPSLREQQESVWTRLAPVYDSGLLPAGGGNTLYTEALDMLCGDLSRCHRVLEAGVGTGLLGERLARQGAEVHGIDCNLAMLAHSRYRAARVNHEGWGPMYVGEGNVEELFFADETFDGYCSNNVLFDADLERALREAYRVLKPGGVLAVNSLARIPDLESLGGLADLRERGVQERVATRFVTCQAEMLEGQALRQGVRTHCARDVVALLTRVGFGRIERTATTYNGANFYVVASK